MASVFKDVEIFTEDSRLHGLVGHSLSSLWTRRGIIAVKIVQFSEN